MRNSLFSKSELRQIQNSHVWAPGFKLNLVELFKTLDEEVEQLLETPERSVEDAVEILREYYGIITLQLVK